MTRRTEKRVFVVAMLAPALVLFTVFVAWPTVRALGFSLLKWDGLTQAHYVGLANFRALLKGMTNEDSFFAAALWHNLFLTLTAGTGTIGLALLFASLIHRRVRGAALFRISFFFPNVLSSVAIALLWILLYSPTTFGVINNALIALKAHTGFPPIDLPFPFTESRFLLYSIVPMLVWTATGFYMVLFLAAMEGIPESLYEAATLDGASPGAQFWFITLPLIREVLTVGLVFLVVGSLKLFDVIWVMENQQPRKESHVLGTLLYQKVFSEYDVGYGSAVAVVLFALVFLATLVTLRLSRKEALEY